MIDLIVHTTKAQLEPLVGMFLLEEWFQLLYNASAGMIEEDY